MPDYVVVDNKIVKHNKKPYKVVECHRYAVIFGIFLIYHVVYDLHIVMIMLIVFHKDIKIPFLASVGLRKQVVQAGNHVPPFLGRNGKTQQTAVACKKCNRKFNFHAVLLLNGGMVFYLIENIHKSTYYNNFAKIFFKAYLQCS